MENVKKSQVLLRKRKMMLVLPLLVIPFITLAFWAMGGKANGDKQTDNKIVSGLNLHLPDPKLKKETILDKLGFYNKADKDSLKLKEEMRNDPYYQEKQSSEISEPSNELERLVRNSARKFHQSTVTSENKLNTSPYNTNTNQAEEKLMQKLVELNKAINQPQTKSTRTDDYSYVNNSPESDSRLDANARHLQSIMQSINQSNDGDSELDKLSGMMDKIIDIQHPERLKEQLKQKSLQQTNVFAVSDKSIDDTIVNGFYSLDAPIEAGKSNAIEAVVNESQVLINGSVIKLRLINDAYIKDIKIAAGNFVFGIVSLDGERLNIEINSIRVNNSIYPVKMEVYDMDGIAGIYIPGTSARAVARQSADNSLQTMELPSLDPSLAAQATAAGISTVKNLLSKKIRLEKVTVKAGYKILLKDKSNEQ